jgi:hypothetical protein
MKKLLFTLVAAAAGGVASAVAPTATFDGLTAFDPTKTDDGTAEVDNTHPGYWEIEVDTSSEPELTIAALSETDKYLQLNTGSTPLWRTFNSVNSVLAATNATLDAGAYATNGVVVSSDVKLTACTEWPTLTDFADEKLALFLFAPEEGDTSGKTNGLYAVGGAWVTVDGVPVFTNKAYRLNVTGNVTNDAGWATIAIKAYDNILNAATPKYPGFLVAVNGTVVSIATEEADYAGFATRDMNNTASTRYGDKELIPAADTGDFKGLGFQGEGGIDNVNLAAAEITGMADAVTMTANITNATVTWTSEGTVLSGSTLTFLPDAPVTFEVTPHFDILTVKYNNQVLTAVEGVYTIESPAANATLEVKAEPALFEANDTGYATFAEALAAALAEGGDGEVKLLGDADLGTEGAEIDEGDEIIIDLNGHKLSATGAEEVIYNDGGAVTIKDSSEAGTGMVDGSIKNAAGTLTINAGTYEGEIFTNEGEEGEYVGTATINDGKFKVKVEGATLPDGMDWSETTDKDGYYTLVEDAGEDPEPEVPSVPEVPTVDKEVGEVEVADGNATVTVTNASESVTVKVPDGFTGTVSAVVPPAVSSIVGVSAAGSVTVEAEGVNITGAFKITYDSNTKTATIALDENGVVTIEGEPIPVKPALAATDAEGVAVAPFEVSAKGDAAANVAAIPGLTYELETTADLANDFGQITENDAPVEGAKVKATGKRVKLEDKRSNKGAKGFYRVKVTK